MGPIFGCEAEVMGLMLLIMAYANTIFSMGHYSSLKRIDWVLVKRFKEGDGGPRNCFSTSQYQTIGSLRQISGETKGLFSVEQTRLSVLL